ncbi:3-isopropylmalate dehydratase small subunit [Spirochaeta africana]|uniref:3-isopropylmalate dehydratase n=1 Tax=Spirochaeta africana (strain ATCC 700263 / DSM 8902 / Z-7692) TaxID=889378 RepID=H9ULI4_SPIAZ|nr:3-isopropylmalate dehydratase small subunit [Spirochaeta africana]AFG38377.1 3-isopropylmalate dehydratase small subunit [Spirochaeta africana DSM 8902]
MSNEIKVHQVTGRAVPVVGDDIDTDRIIPARYLKEITFSSMGEYPFYDERFEIDGALKKHPFNEPKHQGARILLANVNFGCGSSREHAPQSLHRWGIDAVVAESFAEIFAGNCVMLGVPAVVAAKADVAALQQLADEHPETEFTVDLDAMEVRAGAPGAAAELTVAIEMPESRRSALREGTWDSTTLLVNNAELVRQTAAKLPYMAWGRGA